jgi:hypothetical protein
MQRFSKYGTAIVVIHALLAMVHGSAHTHLGISLNLGQNLFVVIVIMLAPLVSMILLWTRLRRLGAAVLFLSMAGSLVFGVAYHFVVVSNDHLLHLPAGDWQVVFQATAVLLFISEICGCWIGARGWHAFKSKP